MTEKRFKMSNSRVKATGIILEKELSTDEVFNEIVYLTNENEQLKQRNSRQAKRLDNLYHLIEKEDWQTLKGIIQEFQECEEQ